MAPCRAAAAISVHCEEMWLVVVLGFCTVIENYPVCVCVMCWFPKNCSNQNPTWITANDQYSTATTMLHNSNTHTHTSTRSQCAEQRNQNESACSYKQAKWFVIYCIVIRLFKLVAEPRSIMVEKNRTATATAMPMTTIEERLRWSVAEQVLGFFVSALFRALHLPCLCTIASI